MYCSSLLVFLPDFLKTDAKLEIKSAFIGGWSWIEIGQSPIPTFFPAQWLMTSLRCCTV